MPYNLALVYVHLLTLFANKSRRFWFQILIFPDACHNKECPFLHIDPETKVRDCPWYDRGFCRHGPTCRHLHVRKVICSNYMAGFCPDGPDCPDTHPRFEVPVSSGGEGKRVTITCHFCGEPGHKMSECLQDSNGIRKQQRSGKIKI